MPIYGIPYYSSFYLSTVCIVMLIPPSKIVNSSVLRNERYNGSSNVLYDGYTHSDDSIKCSMKKYRLVYCFCRA